MCRVTHPLAILHVRALLYHYSFATSSPLLSSPLARSLAGAPTDQRSLLPRPGDRLGEIIKSKQGPSSCHKLITAAHGAKALPGIVASCAGARGTSLTPPGPKLSVGVPSPLPLPVLYSQKAGVLRARGWEKSHHGLWGAHPVPP